MQSLSFDIPSERKVFLSFSVGEKRKVLIMILNPYSHEGENLHSIVQYLNDSSLLINDDDLIEIYDIVLALIHEAQEQVKELNDDQLKRVSEKMKKMKDQEGVERKNDVDSANGLLTY